MTTAKAFNELKQETWGTKARIDDFVEKTNFHDKLKNLYKKVFSNKIRHVETEKKVIDKNNDLTNKVAQISEKGYDFLLGKMYFTGDDDYHNFLVFVPMFNNIG